MSTTRIGQRERSPTLEDLLRLSFQAQQARLWTALPGKITKFTPAKMTVEVQPTINGAFPQPDGTFVSVPMPVLLDCPVLWPGGGGATLTFPIAVGDECLVIFASRCIDQWWDTGQDTSDPPEYRMHNLSDGFALVGVRSKTKAFAVDTTKVVLRSNDGLTSIALDPAGKTLAMTAQNGINLNGATIDASGNISSPGTVTATTDVVGGGKHLKTHTHSGGTISGNTGAPL